MIEPLLQAERLLLHGMLEQAEQIYRRVSEQDPLNAIAVVGLARVALERGDDEVALMHARAALAIDPENATAIKLEARLSEVLAERARLAALEAGSAGAGPVRSTATGQPAWSSTAPAGPAQPTLAGEAKPSEQVAFARNPSMADHRRRDEVGDAPEQGPGQPPAKSTPSKKRGLLRRLLRR